MDNYTTENVLQDITSAILGGMECDVSEYQIVMDKEYRSVIDGKLTIIAPTGQRFVVQVVEEK